MVIHVRAIKAIAISRLFIGFSFLGGFEAPLALCDGKVNEN